jgi:DNA-binding NtrC family response regulator
MTPTGTLIVSQNPTLIDLVQSSLGRMGTFSCRVCPSLQDACRQVEQDDIALVLVDLLVGPHQEVLHLLNSIASSRKICSTVVFFQGATDDQLASLFRAGVADCLQLTDDLPRSLEILPALIEVLRPSRDAAVGVPPTRQQTPAEVLEGLPWQVNELAEQVSRVAPQETTVLLTGETGTGKTRLARLIHELSPRRSEPFLVVDCGALSAGLIESELFGHAKGAFTGADRERQGKLAAAGSGTLLLDEVNSLPLAVQAKLLRAVDERVFEPLGSEKSRPLRARLIAASNVALPQEIDAGRFRADLFYRLNVVAFFLPPLRDRRQAIGALAEPLLQEVASRSRPDVTGISLAARCLLERYDWPGNVRELRNVIERGVALCQGPLLGPEDLPEVIQKPLPTGDRVGETPLAEAPTLATATGPLSLAQSKEEAEIRRIHEALANHNGNRVHAAAELGISRIALYKKLHKYGLMRPRCQA